jgi:hypothetical protein
MSYSGLFKNPDKQILALQWVRKTNSFVRVIFTLLIFLVWIIDLGYPNQEIFPTGFFQCMMNPSCGNQLVASVIRTTRR